MTDIVLTNITSGYNLSKINANFAKVEEVINEEVLHTEGGNNTMQQDLDLNGHDLLNVNVNPDNPGSLLTKGAADVLYYNIKGDSLEGPFDAAGQEVSGLRESVNPTDAVRKQELTDETNARVSEDAYITENYQAADANIQAQLTGNVPLEASAFSPISWHEQSVDNSVVIPANKNAWSFGPIMTISPGQAVTIGNGSFWTIANGEVV